MKRLISLLVVLLWSNLAAAQVVTSTPGVVPVVGTWTPVLTAATPGDLNIVYSTQIGTYVKIGPLVMASGTVITSTYTFSTASGQVRVLGLPYAAPTGGFDYLGALSFVGINKANYTNFNAQVGNSQNYITFPASGNGQNVGQILMNNTTSGTQVTYQFTVVYRAAD